MQTVDLNLQPLGSPAGPPTELAALLVSPSLQASFTLHPPPTLQRLYQAWLARFLQHHHLLHHASEAALPESVVEDYGQRLSTALQQWFNSGEWAPLHRALRRHPGAPLRLRLALATVPSRTLRRHVRSIGSAQCTLRRPRVAGWLGPCD